jgi:disulfide bond formation protein DsbB
MARVDKRRAAATRAVAPVEQAEPLRLADRLALACRHVALLAAVLATCGSLFFSEVLQWQPCELCWFQRILMYPLTLILLVGILRGDQGLHLYVLPLSLTGIAVSLYHYLVVMLILPPPACGGAVSCAFDYINYPGALSVLKIPFLALIAFIIISVMMGNHALAEQTNPRSERGRTIARSAALIIVLATAAVFVGMGALI